MAMISPSTVCQPGCEAVKSEKKQRNIVRGGVWPEEDEAGWPGRWCLRIDFWCHSMFHFLDSNARCGMDSSLFDTSERNSLAGILPSKRSKQEKITFAHALTSTHSPKEPGPSQFRSSSHCHPLWRSKTQCETSTV